MTQPVMKYIITGEKGYPSDIVSKCLEYCDKTPIDWRLNALGFALKINELCDKMLWAL